MPNTIEFDKRGRQSVVFKLPGGIIVNGMSEGLAAQYLAEGATFVQYGRLPLGTPTPHKQKDYRDR